MTHPAAGNGEFSRGWKVLTAAGVGIAFGASPIPFNMLGPLTIPLEQEFGWDRAQIQLTILLFAIVVSFLAPVYGVLMDKFGVRKVALLSCLGFGLSWALVAASTSNILLFYAIFIMVGLLGGGSIPVSWTRAVNAWFVKNRGTALALALTGTGLAGVILQLAVPRLLEAFGWRGAVLATACLPLLIALPLAFVWFREPKPEEAPLAAQTDPAMLQGRTLGEAMREYRFWCMWVMFGLIALAFGGLFTNYVPLLMDKGYTAAQAGAAAAVIGVSVMAGRLLAGVLIDRYWAPLVAFPMLSVPAAACWLLMQDQVSLPEAMAAAALVGLAAGVETDLIAYLSARYYGLKNYGKIYGFLYMPFGLASAISAPLYARVFDQTGSYNLALIVAAFLFVFSAAMLLTIGRYPAGSGGGH